MDTVTQIQILDEAVCILHIVDALGNGIFPPAMGE